MVKYTMGPSPGKATKPGGPKSLFQWHLKVLILLCHLLFMPPPALGASSTSTKGMGDVGSSVGCRFPRAPSVEPFWPPRVQHSSHCDPGRSRKQCLGDVLHLPPVLIRPGEGRQQSNLCPPGVCKISHLKWKLDSQSCWALGIQIPEQLVPWNKCACLSGSPEKSDRKIEDLL